MAQHTMDQMGDAAYSENAREDQEIVPAAQAWTPGASVGRLTQAAALFGVWSYDSPSIAALLSGGAGAR